MEGWEGGRGGGWEGGRRGGRGREVGRGFLKRRGGSGGGAEPEDREKRANVKKHCSYFPR